MNCKCHNITCYYKYVTHIIQMYLRTIINISSGKLFDVVNIQHILHIIITEL